MQIQDRVTSKQNSSGICKVLETPDPDPTQAEPPPAVSSSSKPKRRVALSAPSPIELAPPDLQQQQHAEDITPAAAL